jgi:hypothetical protein
MNSIELTNLPTKISESETQIVIIDMMGRILVNTKSSQKSAIFDNLPLRNGVYFVSLYSEGNSKTFKILKNE